MQCCGLLQVLSGRKSTNDIRVDAHRVLDHTLQGGSLDIDETEVHLIARGPLKVVLETTQVIRDARMNRVRTINRFACHF